MPVFQAFFILYLKGMHNMENLFNDNRRNIIETDPLSYEGEEALKAQLEKYEKRDDSYNSFEDETKFKQLPREATSFLPDTDYDSHDNIEGEVKIEDFSNQFIERQAALEKAVYKLNQAREKLVEVFKWEHEDGAGKLEKVQDKNFYGGELPDVAKLRIKELEKQKKAYEEELSTNEITDEIERLEKEIKSLDPANN